MQILLQTMKMKYKNILTKKIKWAVMIPAPVEVERNTRSVVADRPEIKYNHILRHRIRDCTGPPQSPTVMNGHDRSCHS